MVQLLPGRGGDLRPGALAGAAAQPRAPPRRRGRRPDDADPRDLRRARAEPRRQAAGRAGAPAIPVDAAGAALEPPRAPARRHRQSRRPGRSADRARPAHDRRAHQGHQEAAREGQAPAQHAAARARAQRRPSASRSSATPTPASRRSSTRSSTPTPMPPTSCSRRSTRRRASCISKAWPARSRSPTRSASSATCRTTLIEAFQATLQEAADADLLLHVVDGASPELAEQMAEVQRVLAEIGAADVAADGRLQQARPPGRDRAPACPASTPSSCPTAAGRRASSSARGPAKGSTLLRAQIADRCDGARRAGLESTASGRI